MAGNKNSHRWKNYKKPVVRCEECGKDISVSPSLVGIVKTCSWECRRKRHERKYPSRVCVGCGKTFRAKTHHRTALYCSKECCRKNKKGNGRVWHGPQVVRFCVVCNKEFKVFPGTVKGRFCSKACHDIAQATSIEKECRNCGGKFKIRPSEIKKGGGVFCSRACHNEGKAKESAKAICRSRRKCEHCGWGEIQEILEVHHKDRNRRNNKIENLELLCSRCHDIVHYLAKDGPFTYLRNPSQQQDARFPSDRSRYQRRVADEKEDGEVMQGDLLAGIE